MFALKVTTLIGVVGYVWAQVGLRQSLFQAHFEEQKLNLTNIQSTESYTTLVHPRFPSYGVRIKKTDFCDPTVK